MPPKLRFIYPLFSHHQFLCQIRLLATNRKMFTKRKKEDQLVYADEMKDQLLVLMKDLTQWEKQLFHSLMSLTQEKNYAHKGLFHFLMSLTQEKNYARKSVSFFNELEIENKLCSLLDWIPGPLFHFLMILT
jgi:hypothetical protein